MKELYGLIILINFANHFEIISTLKEFDDDKIQNNYNYIVNILKYIKVKFSFDVVPRYGYVNTQVSLLGGGFKLIGLLQLKNIKKIENILKNFNFT